MDKEKAIMEVLYSKYGSILEKYGYKPNKAKNKYSIKTKNNLSEVSFLFSKRSNILHLVYSYTDLKAGKLHIDIENQHDRKASMQVRTPGTVENAFAPNG